MLQDIIALEKNIETREDYKKAIETYCGWKVAAIMNRMRGNPQNMVMMMCKAVMDFEMGILPQVESDPIAYADGVGVFMEQMKVALNNHYDFDNDTLFNTEYQFLLNYIYHGMD